MLIKIFGSGTNVQRLSKGAGKANGFIYTAYSQLENSNEPGLIRRKFFMLNVNDLKKEVETLDEKIQPSWANIWGKPYANQIFITKLFQKLVGEDSLSPGLNLSNLAGEPVNCFMLLVSANNNEMEQVRLLAEKAIPNYTIIKLNGDTTSNRKAEIDTTAIINKSRIAKKSGVVIISNIMGSRSYSISEIQSTVIAYDRGSVDTTTQKVSRCLTPGEKYDENEKTHGHIVDLSFDPNRGDSQVGVTGAISYKENDSAFTGNGIAISSDVVCKVPDGPNKLLIGRGYTAYLNGYIEHFAYYRKAINDSELQIITQQ